MFTLVHKKVPAKKKVPGSPAARLPHILHPCSPRTEIFPLYGTLAVYSKTMDNLIVVRYDFD